MENINPRDKNLHVFIMSTGLTILNRGTESTFMNCRRQKIIDITIYSKKLMSGRLKGFWSILWFRAQTNILCPQHVVEEWDCNPRYTNWKDYGADLEVVLKKAASRFHILDNLEVTAQFTSDAIIVAFKANCPLKPKTHNQSFMMDQKPYRNVGQR